jgi:hypothetical protein
MAFISSYKTLDVVFKKEVVAIPWHLAKCAGERQGDLQAPEPIVLLVDVQRATSRDKSRMGKNDAAVVAEKYFTDTGAAFQWRWYYRAKGSSRAAWMRAFRLADLEAFIRSSPFFCDMTWNSANFLLQLCSKLTAFATQVEHLKDNLQQSEARRKELELEHAAALETIKKLREQHQDSLKMMAAGHSVPMDAHMDETEDGTLEELETPEENTMLSAMMYIAENSDVAQQVAVSPLLEKKLKAMPRAVMRGGAVAASLLSTTFITAESGLESGELPVGSLQSPDSEPMSLRPSKKRKREDAGAQNLNAAAEQQCTQQCT